MSNYSIVDTHAHMCDAGFDADRGVVLERARKAGVTAILALGENMADAEKNLELAGRYAMLKPGAGLYPAIVDGAQADQMVAFIEKHRRQLAAIGEVGLDHWVVKDQDAREIQAEIFKQFIALSIRLDLPLNVHSRSAGKSAIRMLLDNEAKKVQMHAFDGKASSAMAAVEAGYYFSVPPSVVRSRQKQKLVKQLPLTCLLLETDSPVLGPDPKKRNEPANIVQSADAIAQIKQIRIETVYEAAARNANKLYGL